MIIGCRKYPVIEPLSRVSSIIHKILKEKKADFKNVHFVTLVNETMLPLS